MSWSDERVELAIKLWAQGLSASQIAERVGKSRSAVIGKIHRLNQFPPRGTGKKYGGGNREKAPARVTKPVKPKKVQPVFEAEPYVPTPYVELVIPVAERKTIETLENDSCRWPIGDPQSESFHFCGKHKMDGISYCEFHARRAFAAPQARTGRPVGLARSTLTGVQIPFSVKRRETENA